MMYCLHITQVIEMNKQSGTGVAGPSGIRARWGIEING